MKVTKAQARCFVDKMIGTELCRGAGEDESAEYYVSPIVRAFLEGAVGFSNTPNTAFGGVQERIRPIGEYLIACGEALLADDE